MSELRQIVERADRALERMSLAPDGFDRLVRYRDRKRRKERVAAAAVGLTLAGVAIAIAVGAFVPGESRQRPARPADRNAISTRDVSRLQVAWTAYLGASTPLSDPVAAGDLVVVGSGHTLYAYPAACQDACEPRWTATAEADVLTPAAADGFVFATAGRTLYAFPTTCAGPSCAPEWTAELAGEGTAPVVTDGVVYVSAGNTVSAFPSACGFAVCEPTWRAETGARPGPPFVAEGLVAVGTDRDAILVFPASCGSGGPSCEALWSAEVDGLDTNTGPVVDDGMVYAASDARALHVFAADCGSGGARCEPDRVAPLRALAPHSGRVTADQRLVVGSDLMVFPGGCNPLERSCRPTWTWESPAETHTIAAASSDGVVYVTYHGPGSSAQSWMSALPETCGSAPVCEPLATWPLEREPGTPAIAGGTVYVLAGSGSFVAAPGRLYALRVPTDDDAGGPGLLYPSLALAVGLGVILVGRVLLRRRHGRTSV